MAEHHRQLTPAPSVAAELADALDDVVVGQQRAVRELVMGLCAGGHVLMEGLPGLGKTTLIKRLAARLNLPLARVQCTPDLLPADVIGSEVATPDEGLRFQPGPLFAPVVLVDEINRATPRTQAAFLEAMQEAQVTSLGRRHELPEPFWLLATQNPIELEGTFPLPEAQLDRFIAKVVIEFPDADALMTIAGRTLGLPADAPDEQPVLDHHRMVEERRAVIVAEPVQRQAVELVLALQPDRPESHPLARRHGRYGPSPRAVQALLKMAQAHALLVGRGHVATSDLERAAHPALRHRLLLRFESLLEGVTADSLIAAVCQERIV